MTTPKYTGTAGNDSWTVVGAGTFILDGLGGVDSLYLGTSLRSSYTIALAADGSVHLDTMSGASAPLHATLYNMERLVFNSGRDVLDLTSYFGPAATITDNVAGTATGDVIYTVNFSEAVTGLTAAAFSVTNGTVHAVSGSGSSYTVQVSAPPGFQGTEQLTLLASSVVDAAGHSNAATSAAPQPVDTLAPSLTSFSPADDAWGVAVASNLNFTFSESIARGAGTIALRAIDGGAIVESYDVATSSNLSISGNTLTINPTADLAYGTGYYLDVAPGAVTDIAGNAYAGATGYNFTTSLVNPADPKSAYFEIVQKIYVAYFGRPADTGGLSIASQMLYDAHAPTDTLGFVLAYGANPVVTAILDNFGLSAESKTLYAGATTTDLVTAVYHYLLNRSPDAAGLQFWANAIDQKVLTLAKVALNIMAGAEGYPAADGLTVDKKIVVAQNFTTALNTPAEASAYAGDAAAQAVRTMLGGVDLTTDTGAYETSVLSTIDHLLHPVTAAAVGLVGLAPDAPLV